MKLSVIIPCYNFAEFIEQAITSAINQNTNFEYEILIRDDFSPDTSYTNIERTCLFAPNKKNIRNFKPEKNIGANRNIKFLLEQAKGEYIAYLDGDDYWIEPTKLQRQVDFLENNKDYSVTFSGYWMKKPDGKYEPDSPYVWFSCRPEFNNRDINTIDLLNYNWVTFGRVFKNTPDLVKDWMLDLPILDWPINYELSKIGKVKYLNFPCGIYRISDKSIFANLSESEAANKVNITRKAIREDYKKINPDYDLNSPL